MNHARAISARARPAAADDPPPSTAVPDEAETGVAGVLLPRTASGAVLALAIAACVSAAPARAGDSIPGCLDGSAQEAVAAGDGGGPPGFTSPFYRQTFALDASTDGFARRYLTISIEDVCDVPAAYATQAVQLAGSDGVAVITSHTRVFKGKRLLSGARRRTQIAGADTMRLTVRLLPPSQWRPGEDGKLPTFSTRRVAITD